MKKKIMSVFCIFILLINISGCSISLHESSIYEEPENWAYLEIDKKALADVFFICPTVFGGNENAFNMSLDDKETKEAFLGATNMEKGIYDQDSRFFAPYYRQAGLNVYELEKSQRETYLSIAFDDIKEAFLYYMDHYNSEKPIILAGFSQGADMCIRLLKDKQVQEELDDLLVACYAIGWSITKKELSENPNLNMAQKEDDTNVIISFNSESEKINDSLIIPSGMHTLSINPLNWKTDNTIAQKEENLGACFTNYEGTITSEIPQFTGAYIDPLRGSLKVLDVDPEQYPPVLSIFSEGVYHLYDYQFFYRNLQENVNVRLNAYLNEHDS